VYLKTEENAGSVVSNCDSEVTVPDRALKQVDRLATRIDASYESGYSLIDKPFRFEISLTKLTARLSSLGNGPGQLRGEFADQRVVGTLYHYPNDRFGTRRPQQYPAIARQ
jgi:hypothetical protein